MFVSAPGLEPIGQDLEHFKKKCLRKAEPMMCFSRICFIVSGGRIHDLIILFVNDFVNSFGAQTVPKCSRLDDFVNSFGGVISPRARPRGRALPNMNLAMPLLSTVLAMKPFPDDFQWLDNDHALSQDSAQIVIASSDY